MQLIVLHPAQQPKPGAGPRAHGRPRARASSLAAGARKLCPEEHHLWQTPAHLSAWSSGAGASVCLSRVNPDRCPMAPPLCLLSQDPPWTPTVPPAAWGNGLVLGSPRMWESPETAPYRPKMGEQEPEPGAPGHGMGKLVGRQPQAIDCFLSADVLLVSEWEREA